MFPFVISYKIKLNLDFLDQMDHAILAFLSDYMKQYSADEVKLNDVALIYKTHLLSGRGSWHILSGVEKGVFKINRTQGMTILSYRFYMYRLFVMSLVFGGLVALISGDLSEGLYTLLFLFVANWGITLYRHRIMLLEIKEMISEFV